MLNRTILVLILVAGYALHFAQYAAAADVISQISFSKLRTLEPGVRLKDQKKDVPIAANDIGVGANGAVWVASQHGVFLQKGAGWEQVPTTSTSIFSENLDAVKRIDVDERGNPWVIDDKGILYTRKDKAWIRMLSNAKDVGAGKGALWIIPTEDSSWVKGAGGGAMVVLSATLEGGVSAYTWQSSFGKPVAVDVDENGIPHVATASGKVAKFAYGTWQQETVTCSVAGDKDCDPTRVFNDIAASNMAIWIAGTGQATGDATFHYTGGKLSGTGLFPALAPGLKSISSDARGNLYGVNARGEIVFGEISYDYQSGSNLLGAALEAAFDAPFLRKMTTFDQSSIALAVDIPDPKAGEFDYQAALNPTDDLTVSFSIYPPATPDVAAGSNCIISYRSSKTEYFSICLDALHQNMTVAVGAQKKTFPVQLRGETFVDLEKQPYTAEDVGRKFVFRSELGRASIETVSAPMTVNNGAPTPAKKATFTQLAEMSLPAGMKFDKGGARLYIGSRDGVQDKYRGYLGTVRVIDSAVEVNHLLANWQNGQKAKSHLPGYPGLLAEAVLNPRNKDAGAYAVALNRPIDLSGFWYKLGAGDYYSREVKLDPRGLGTWGIDRIELFKIEHTTQSSALSPQRLRIVRDGEGGVVTTSFEQSADNTYKGWQDPATKKIQVPVATVAGSAVQLQPVAYELSLLDSNTIIVRNAEDKSEYRLARVPAYKEVDSPGRQIGQTTMNYLGYDILTLSPYFELGARKNNVFETEERDSSGNAVPRLNRDERKVPWGVLYKKIDQGTAINQSRVMESTRELQEDLRLSIGASIEVPEVVSFSQEAKFQQQVRNMSQQKTMKAIGEMYWAGHALILDPARMKLDAGFVSAVNQAKQDLVKSKSVEGLKQIIKIYGTHYTNHVIYGSRARSEKSISEEAVEREVEKQWDIESKNSGTIKGVKLGLDVAFGMGAKSEFRKATTKEDSKTSVSSGTTSFDTEEVMVGEDQERSNAIALDLRPITDLLSPIYFDDPYTYTELRAALASEINRYVTNSDRPEGLSEQSLIPNIFAISIDKFIAKSLGDGAVDGKVSLFVRKPGESKETERVLWQGPSGKPTDAENGEIIIAKNDFLSLVQVGADIGSARIEADLKGANVATKFSKFKEEIPLAYLFVNRLPHISSSFTTIGDSCQCMTACPEGYEDSSGQCLRKCPEGFDTRGGTCYGVKYGATYFAWEKSKCEAAHPTTGCDQHGLYVQEACPANYNAGGFGICLPICSKFNLESWGGTDVTCSRPEVARTKTGRSPNNQCTEGSVPGNDCSRVKVEYTVTPIRFEDGK